MGIKMKRIKTECEKQFILNNKKNFYLTICAYVMLTVMQVVLAFMIQMFVESVEAGSMDLLWNGVKLFVVLIITYGGFSLLQRNYRNAYMRKGLSQFKDYVFRRMLDKSISQFGDGTSAKFISAFSNDLNSIETNYLTGTLEIIVTVMMFLGGAGAMVFLEWRLAVPVLLTSVICILLSLKYGQKLVQKEHETSEENMGFVAQVKDLLSGFIVIKSFKAEKEVLDIFRKKNRELETTKQGKRETSDTVVIFAEISSILVNVMIFGFGFYMAFQGKMTLGQVIAFVQLGNYILQPVRVLSPLLSNRKAAIGLIERLSEAVEADEEAASRGREALQGREAFQEKNIDGFHDSIRFRDVSFGYEDEEVLKNIDITFEKGKSYAIVGGSGSGKSTLLKLMLGHRRDYTGEVLLDGSPMKEINLDSLYNHLSVIQQEVFLFDSSIKDNITMFREFGEDKVRNAVVRAGLDKLMEEKGEGYNCGEAGKNLSGGEKQRVSIARCLVRDTPVLLMDEATAALDNNTALLVENAILDIEDLTRVIVTHRFHEDVMRKYDEIIVMNKGRVIEKGAFRDLMESKGYFYSLFNVAG